MTARVVPTAGVARIGLSACLLGEGVRYDGAHKRSALVAERLAPWVTLVPVCPETEAGLGVPRVPMRLEGALSSPALVTLAGPRKDLTGVLDAFCERTLPSLACLDGYILKSRSPSCGWESVPVKGSGATVALGSGVFARRLARRYAALPLIDEQGLLDPGAWDRFLVAVFASRRWRAFTSRDPEGAGLQRFHRSESLLLRAFIGDERHWLGRLAQAASGSDSASLEGYRRLFSAALRTHSPSLATHLASLRLALRSVRRYLGQRRWRMLRSLVDDLEVGRIDLGQALGAFRECLQHDGPTTLVEQSYFAWDPSERALRFGL